MDSPPEKTARLFSHLLLSEKTWIEGIQGRRSTQMNIWQALSPHEWEIIIHENEKNYLDYISGTSDDDLQPKISYTSSKGIENHTPREDIRPMLACTMLVTVARSPLHCARPD